MLINIIYLLFNITNKKKVIEKGLKEIDKQNLFKIFDTNNDNVVDF